VCRKAGLNERSHLDAVFYPHAICRLDWSSDDDAAAAPEPAAQTPKKGRKK
jgi:hypothetical protein